MVIHRPFSEILIKITMKVEDKDIQAYLCIRLPRHAYS